jgi:hypothetical protein
MSIPATRVEIPARDVLFISTPALWPAWPFLPVVRRTGGTEEIGLMYDARGTANRTGYSATVFLANLFDLPPTEAAFLALPKEVYDSAEEVAAAGWRVD